MAVQKTKNNKAILSEESNAGGITIPDFNYTTAPQQFKISMVLAQKQTQRSME
jgi:hypothetical protein